jgi:hypothetical protein
MEFNLQLNNSGIDCDEVLPTTSDRSIRYRSTILQQSSINNSNVAPRTLPTNRTTQIIFQPQNRSKRFLFCKWNVATILQILLMVVLLIFVRTIRKYVVLVSQQREENKQIDTTIDVNHQLRNNIQLDSNLKPKAMNQLRSEKYNNNSNKVTTTTMNDLDHPKIQITSLDQFPTLQHICRQNYKLIGLYFAASWCPMSTPTTKLLDTTFRHYLLSTRMKPKQLNETTFTIVYVASDSTIESFYNYIQPGWDYIPYNNTIERSNIKQIFHTCAKREIDVLHMTDRWYEIPNLIILKYTRNYRYIDSVQQLLQVITYHGLKDVRKYGIHALQIWNK